MIKAVETLYKGYRFRSRLEARWAVFFDHLGLTWQYEPEGFELVTGRYLPDFLVEGVWVEVKPFVGSDTAKSMQFSRESGCDIVICYGVPEMTTQTLYTSSGVVHDAVFTPGKYRPVYKSVGQVKPGDPTPTWWSEIPVLIEAVHAAKQARFGV